MERDFNLFNQDYSMFWENPGIDITILLRFSYSHIENPLERKNRADHLWAIAQPSVVGCCWGFFTWFRNEAKIMTLEPNISFMMWTYSLPNAISENPSTLLSPLGGTCASIWNFWWNGCNRTSTGQMSQEGSLCWAALLCLELIVKSPV